MKKFFADFKKFISRGNILDMAVGVIVGGAFSAIVTALTNSIIRPLINYLLAAITGGDGLSAVYTFLKTAYTTDATTGERVIDLTNSIYIDWGNFITKIIDFLIIAFTIFVILKIVMKSQELMKETAKHIEKVTPNKAERKILKERGVNLKDRKAVREALLQLAKEEEEAKKAAEAAKPAPETEISLLKEIKVLMQAQLEASKPAEQAKTEE